MPRSREPISVAGVSVQLDAPGLKAIRRHGGRVEARWFAAPRAIRRGYQPKTVRLHYDLQDTFAVQQMAARCRQLQAEMLDWLADPERKRQIVFDGTLGSLIRLYQEHPESPFHGLRNNTRRTYEGWCRALSEACGARRVDRITGPDLRRWYKEFRRAALGEAPRDRMAYAVVRQMLRILVNYGMELNLKPCFELDRIISVVRFRADDDHKAGEKRARKQRQAMTFEQASAIVDAGLAKGTVRHRSVALGIAMQFEFGLAQIDVIGEWEKIDRVRGVVAGAVVNHGQVWTPGLRYEDFADGVLDMARSKTAVPGTYEVAEAPLFMRAVAAVPIEEQTGPVVCDAHRIPIRSRHYADLFRELAETSGVQAEIKSMHARHGAASEADAAGVGEDDIARLLQHSGPAVTRKHYIKGSLERSRRTQRARVAHRERKETA